MTPTPGTDCFVVYSCNEAGEGCSVAGTFPSVADENKPIQVFFDADGFVWVVVIQYATDAFGGVFPYWVQIYRSIEPLDCELVRAGGEEGYTPEGPGSTEWFELKCEGLHKDYADSDCPSQTTPPLFDSVFIGLTFFSKRFHCCLGFSDPCNEIPEGACEGAGDNCEHCSNCDDGIAPAFMLFEIDRGYLPLAYADGSFVLAINPTPCESPPHECSWVGCFEVNDTGPNAIRSIKIVASLTGWAGGTDPDFEIFHYTSSDCSGTCLFSEQDGTAFEDAGSDCLAIDYEWDPPPGYALVSCTGGATPIPTWSPYARLRSL